MDGVVSVPAREACQHGWCGWRAIVGGGLTCVAWVEWVMCLCGWHASVGGMSCALTIDKMLLLLLLLKYYPK